MKLSKSINWEKLKRIVERGLKNDKSGHDYAHALRVLENALLIAKSYSGVDYDILVSACYLHDISCVDGFVKDHHLVSAKLALPILKKINFPDEKIKRVQIAIEDYVGNISQPIRKNKELQIESKILRDADNLDALSEIGIERQLAFCKSHGISLFKSKRDKFNDSAYGGIKEILKWANKMLTPEGKALGEKRIRVMKSFLKNIEKEEFLQSFSYFVGKNKKTIKVEVCDTIWKKFSGLMFRKNSPPLLFPFNKNKNLTIHSFFCKPFKAVWLDGEKQITKEILINRWLPSISGRGKYLLEIPVQK